jgi:nucleotide-binding universal stress UspA family protein
MEWPLFEGAEIRVLTVVDPADAAEAPGTSDVTVGETHTTSTIGATSRASGVAGAAAEQLASPNRSVSIEVRTGDPMSQVIAAANELQTDLVVVGVNGEPRVRRLLLGSVARRVLGSVASSVLVVRPPAASLGTGDDA